MSDLTKAEQDNVRSALRFMRAQYGLWQIVGKTLRINPNTIADILAGRRNASVTLALRIARDAQVGVDDVLTGAYPPAGVCPHCGQQIQSAPS